MTNIKLPEEVESFWHKTSHVDDYPKLEEDLTVDVAIIGGGIAGILSAYEIASRGGSVALFEARKLIYGTTGYTTSKLSAQHNIIYDELIERYGTEKAREYYDANMEGIEIIREIAKKYNIECELKEDNAYIYTQLESQKELMKKEAKAYEKLSIDGGLVGKLLVDLDIEAAVVMHKQYEFHPVMFLSGVLKELEKMDVLIYENTMITEVNDGEEVKLKTEDDKTITCKQAICASHYPVDDPEKHYADNMEPEISFATIYKMNKKYPGGMYLSYDHPRRTFREVDAQGEKYLLVGGGSHRLGTGSSDLERYESIVDFAEEVFGVKEVVSRFSSHDYLTKDGMPFVGLTSPDRKNVYVATGYNKWGLSNAAISAKLLADIIDGKENSLKELFNPHREIKDIERKDQEKPKKERKSSTPKEKVEDLKNGEALTYEKDDEHFGIFKDEDGEIHHLDITCTHLGCGLGWNDGDKTWDCKCHGSRFNSIGEVIEGPAMEPLKKLDKKEILD